MTPGEKFLRINSIPSQGGDHQLEPGVKVKGCGWVGGAQLIKVCFTKEMSYLLLASEQAMAESGWGNSSTWFMIAINN